MAITRADVSDYESLRGSTQIVDVLNLSGILLRFGQLPAVKSPRLVLYMVFDEGLLALGR